MLTESNPLRIGDNYPEENFGLIDFDWADAPAITMRILDAGGLTVLEETVPLATLDASATRR